MKVLLDIDVVLDVLADREPWAEDGAAVLSRVESGDVEGVIAAHTVTTLHYLLGRELAARKAARALADLLGLVGVVPLDEDRLRHALAMAWDDFEDAVQAASAEAAEVDYLITRNTSDFAGSPVRVLSPAAFLALLP